MLKDSGERREFNSGAVRDISQGKGRCDLLPHEIIGEMLDDDFFTNVGKYVYTGEQEYIFQALKDFATFEFEDWYTALLEVSIHFEEGAKKYADRNFEKGMPLHCFIDSGMRHYIKHCRGDNDEPHHRAVIWNLLCALWTQNNHPNLCDLPFVEKNAKSKQIYNDNLECRDISPQEIEAYEEHIKKCCCECNCKAEYNPKKEV